MLGHGIRAYSTSQRNTDLPFDQQCPRPPSVGYNHAWGPLLLAGFELLAFIFRWQLHVLSLNPMENAYKLYC